MITNGHSSYRDLPNEERLLLACARKAPAKKQKHILLEIAHEPLEWQSLVDKAVIHGVEALLYHNLRSHCIGCMPTGIRDYLRKRYMFVTRRNSLFYEQLGEIIKTFEMSDIQVILLKGAFLAAGVYQDIGLRPMSDIDVLIKIKDLARAEGELAALGFSRPSQRSFWIDWNKDWHLLAVHSLPFIKYRGGYRIKVELNWDFISSRYQYIFRIDTNKIWTDALFFHTDVVSGLTLGPEHMLLHLCLHAYKHFVLSGAVRIRWLTDLAETLQYYRSRMDWPKFIKICYEARAVKPVAELLFWSKTFLDAPVPKGVLAPLINDAHLSQAQKVNFIKSMLLPSGDVSQKSNFRNFFIRMSRLYGRLEKIKWVIGTLFPRTAFARYYFPRRPDYAFRHIYKLLRFSLKAIAKVFIG